MRDLILKAAADLNADLVGFAPASRFDSDDVLFQIMPDVKTVIGLGFRVLRGTYRGIEEGSTYYQYTTMGRGKPRGGHHADGHDGRLQPY